MEKEERKKLQQQEGQNTEMKAIFLIIPNPRPQDEEKHAGTEKRRDVKQETTRLERLTEAKAASLTKNIYIDNTE